MNEQPPKLAQWLVRVTTGRLDRDYVLGDLAEEYYCNAISKMGLRRARRWYWRQVLRSIVPGVFGHRNEWFGSGRERLCDGLLHDVRYGCRTLTQHPSFSAVVVITMALAIGSSALIFSVVNAVLLRPLPFRATEQLVHVYEYRSHEHAAPDDDFTDLITVRPGNFHDWRDQNHVFEQFTAYRWRNVVLTGRDQPESVPAQEVTDDFFETLGVQPALGREFSQEDYQLKNAPVAILSYQLWQRRFAADSQVLGASLSVDGVTYSVVGVMPRGFYPTHRETPELWLPLKFDAQQYASRTTWGLTTVGRLRNGVSIAQAATEMEAISRRLETAFPATNDGFGVRLVPVSERLIGSHQRVFLTLLAAVGFLLLIACANFANLLLVRGVERRKEFALRLAMGASRFRLIRQLLTESLLLTSLGGLAGFAFASAALRPILALLPLSSRIPRLETVRLDLPTGLFTLGLCLATGIVFGLAPAFRASNPILAEALNSESRGGSASRRSRRLASLLIVAEVALSLLLVTGAGLMARSFVHLQQTSLGFQPERVLAVQIRAVHTDSKSEEHQATVLEATRERIAHLPGVESAALAGKIPVRQGPNPWLFHIAGTPPDAPGREPFADLQDVSPEYFQTLGMNVLRGRGLLDSDTGRPARYAVINETMAHQYWPKSDPLGQKVDVNLIGRSQTLQVVGVVADAKIKGLRTERYPEMFVPIRQSAPETTWLLVRTTVQPSAMAGLVRREVGHFSAGMPVTEVTTMDRIVADSLWQPRFSMVLLSIFAALALSLGAAGIYGVVSYNIGQRTREIGVRMALGATRRNVLSMILLQGLQLTLAGLILGLVASLALDRLLMSQLYGVSTVDPLTIASSVLLLFTVAMLASALPAMRATRRDAVDSLQVNG